jgi:hypothetical protein
MPGSRKAEARLARRLSEFDDRNSLAAQAPGGQKIVPMMHKPGSQNRKK